MNVSDLIDPSFSYRLITTLVHFLWQGSLVALLAVPGDTLLSRASASRRYTLHVAALTIMIACVTVTFSKVASPISAPSVSTKLAPIVPTTELIAQGQEDVDSSDRPSTFSPEIVGVETPLPESPAAVGTVEMVEPPLGGQERPSGDGDRWQQLQHYAPHIAVLYFVCCGLLLARLVRGTWVAHRMRRLATTVSDDSLIAMLQRQSKELGLRVMPRVAWCAEVSIPLVIGIFKPVILLPFAAATGLSPDQLQALITHELAHIRRYDLLVNLVQRIVESMLFFHPAVWYISRRISSEREQACDELVLATGCERLRYADALVRMAELSSSLRSLRTSAPATSLAASGANSSEFKRRVLKVLSVPTTSDLQPSRIALLVIMVLIVGAAVSASRLHFNVLAESPPKPTPTEIMPPDGLEFLKTYPKLHGLSLDMTEPQFLEIVKQQELKTRKTVEGEKVTHHIGLGDDHTLIVMFDKDAKCSGIQRVRGDDDEAVGRAAQPGKYSARLANGVEVELAGVAMENVAYSDKSKWRKDDAWWRADGTRLQAPPMTLFSSWGQEAQKDFREFAIKLIPAGDAAAITASHVSWTPYPHNGSYGLGGWDTSAGKPGFLKLQHSAGFKDEKPVAVHVFVSDQPFGPAWLIDVNGLALPQKPADAKTESLRKFIQVVGVEKTDNETIFRSKRLPADLDQRLEVNLTAINQNGQSYSSSESRGSDAGQGRVFKLAAADIKYFEIRLRPMTQSVTFENVSLVPGQVTDIKVKVEAIDLLTPQPAAAGDKPASAALRKMADDLVTLLPKHWHPQLVGGQTIEMMPGMYATSEHRPHVVLVFTDDKTRPAMKWERKDEQYEYLGETPHGHGHLFVSMKIIGDAANSEVIKLFDWPEATEFVKAFLKGDHAKLTALRKQAEPARQAANDFVRNGLRFELEAVAFANAELPGGAKRKVDGWWKADGTKLAAAPANLAAVTVPKDRANGSNFREFVMRAHIVDVAEMRRRFPGEVWLPPSPGQWLQATQWGGPDILKFQLVKNVEIEKPASFALYFTDDPWTVPATFDLNGKLSPDAQLDARTTALLQQFDVSIIEKLPTTTIVKVVPTSEDARRARVMLSAIAVDGTRVPATESTVGAGYVIRLLASEIDAIQISLRRMTHKATFENIATLPGQKTEPTVTLEPLDTLVRVTFRKDGKTLGSLSDMSITQLEETLQTMQHDLSSETAELVIDTQLATTFAEAERIVTTLKAAGWKWPSITLTPIANTAATSLPKGLEFLKPYPKLHGLSLDITEPKFLEIIKQQELKTRNTIDDDKVTHHIGLGDGHSLIVMFDQDEKCLGIQRVRTEDLIDQSLPLADVVHDFNAKNKRFGRGLAQQAVTEDEVIAVIKRDKWQRGDPWSLNEQEIAAFKGVAESKRLPKDSYLDVHTEELAETFLWKQLWQVRLMLPAIGHDGFVGLTIRDTLVAEEKIDPKQVAWGKPDAEGLSLGAYLSPKKDKYQIGERVRLRLFVRNEGQNVVGNLTFYNLPTPDAKDFTVTDQTGASVVVRLGHESWDLHLVAGATGGVLKPGDAHAFRVLYEISIGGDGSNPLVGRVIDARPGQTLQLKVRAFNGNDRERKVADPFPESGIVTFAVTLAGDPKAQAAANTSPADGLEFLKPYPKLHGLSLDMTEPKFLEIVKQQELKTRKTVEGEKATHRVALGDGYSLVVMFDKDSKCSGIQRVRGDDAPAIDR